MSKSEPLSDAVRNWVHFENLHTLLSKQANSAHDMKKTFETRIFSLLEGKKQIMTSNAVLEPAVRNENIVVSLPSLESLLHKYYESNKKTDETMNILTFIKQNKKIKREQYIKKTPL